MFRIKVIYCISWLNFEIPISIPAQAAARYEYSDDTSDQNFSGIGFSPKYSLVKIVLARLKFEPAASS